MPRLHLAFALLALLAVTSCSRSPNLRSKAPSEGPIAKVSSVDRALQTSSVPARLERFLKENIWDPINVGFDLYCGDRARTGRNTRASFAFSDGDLLTVDFSTVFEFRKKDTMRLVIGTVWQIIRPREKRRYQVITPTGVMGIEGTEFVADVARDRTVTLTVVKGKVSFTNDLGRSIATASTQVTARPGQAPGKPVLVDLRKILRWVRGARVKAVFFRKAYFDKPEDLAGAIKSAKAALKSNPHDEDAHFTLARAFLDKGNLSGAERELRAASSKTGDSDYLEATALLLLAREDVEGASEALRKACAASPSRALLHTYLAMALYASGDADAAQKESLTAIELDGKEPFLQYQSALLSFLLGNFEESETLCLRCLELNPRFTRARILLGMICHWRGYTSRAKAEYEKAAELDPSDYRSFYNLASVYRSEKDISKARYYIEKAIELNPKDGELRNLQAALHIESGDLDQAERAIRAAMKLEPDNASLHNNLGYISMKKGKLEDAEARFRRAVDLDGTYPEFRLNLGMMLALSKKYREAERELSKALALDPESPEGRSLLRDAAMRLAISLHDRGDYKGALFEFRKLTSLFPEDEEVWNNMGLLLHRMGRFGEAEKVFRKAIAIGGPKSAEVRYSAAWTFLRAGKKQDAAHSFSETIRLSPGGWRSETAKAALLVLEGRHKESLERISNALNLNQNNPYAYYLAGLSLRALGRREEAVIAFEKALQADAGHRDSKDELKRQP